MSGVLWLAATVGVYALADLLYRRTKTPLLHPVVTTTLAVIAALLLTRTTYAVYNQATLPLTFLLIPATAALALPLLGELAAVRKRALAVAVVIATSSAATVVSAVCIARLFGCTPPMVASFGAKALTTPVALAVSAQIGGVPALSAIFAIVSGVIGALVSPLLLPRFGPWIVGSATGAVAHGVGTAQLVRDSESAGAYSGFAMGSNAIVSAVVLPLLARFFAVAAVLLLLCSAPASAADSIVLVPLDDRPVTMQLPQLLGRIAGTAVITPPRALVGNYLTFGRPDALIAWLNSSPDAAATGYVLSSDMLAYGGLVASRVPGPAYADARMRLNELDRLRAREHSARIDVFGTIMRLAPTGVPDLGPGKGYFAAYPAWTYLQEYANLHDPPLPAEEARAQQLRAAIGEHLLDAYLATRARNLAIDRLLIAKQKAGTIDALILGQDDAGPYGLHVRDVAVLTAEAAQAPRISVEPGADELAMAMLASQLARSAHWTPRVEVQYSTPAGAQYQDPLEFAPVSVPVDHLIRACGGEPVSNGGDIALFVRLPGTTAEQDAKLLTQMHDARRRGSAVAVADISFLRNDYGSLAAFAGKMLDDGIARDIDAYASWNTNANTAGTALAEAIAAGAGRRSGRYNALAHRTFTFMRFLDDVDFHASVRPALNTELDRRGVSDHTLLLPENAAPVSALNRALLWYDAQRLLARLYPDLHIAAMDITLPWNRTFEAQIDVGLAPNLGTQPAP